jgi:hypothetical protein
MIFDFLKIPNIISHRSVIFHEKNMKIIFKTLASSAVVMTFWVMHYVRVKSFYLTKHCT